MGFLGDLFKKEAKKMVADSVNRKFGSQTSGKTVKAGNSNVNSRSSKVTARYENQSVDDVKERIRKVLRENYQNYEIGEEMPVEEFGITKEKMKYDFVLYLNGTAKLMILVLSGKNDYKLYRVREAHKVSRNTGIRCINIMTYLPSTYEYINETIYNNL